VWTVDLTCGRESVVDHIVNTGEVSVYPPNSSSGKTYLKLDCKALPSFVFGSYRDLTEAIATSLKPEMLQQRLQLMRRSFERGSKVGIKLLAWQLSGRARPTLPCLVRSTDDVA